MATHPTAPTPHPAPLPASTAPTNPEIHFVAHDASSPEAEWKGHILLASILRKTIFHDELGLPEAEYEHSHEDVKWRHVFTRKGDAPLAYVRWHVHSNERTGRAAFGVLDMLCVTARNRRKHLAKRLICYCMMDIWLRLTDTSEFSGLWVRVPTAGPHVAHTFNRMGFQPVPPGAPVPPGLPPLPAPAPGAAPSHALMHCPLASMATIVEGLQRVHGGAPGAGAGGAPGVVPPPAAVPPGVAAPPGAVVPPGAMPPGAVPPAPIPPMAPPASLPPPGH